MSTELIIKIGAEVSRDVAKAFDSASKSAEGFGQRFDQLNEQSAVLQSQLKGVAIGAGALFAGLTATTVTFFNAYAEGQVELQKTEQILKNTGKESEITADQIKGLSEALQDNSRFADDAIISAAGLLASFNNLSGEAIPRLTQLSADLAERMGGDISSAANVLGKALNDPIGALGALEKQGLKLNDQQKLQIETFTKVGDVGKAQEIIIGELEKQYGGLAKTASEGPAVFTQVKNTLGNIAQAIGEQLAPALIAGGKLLNDFLKVIRDNPVLTKTAALIIGIGLAVTGLVAALASGAIAFLQIKNAMIAANISAKALSLGVKGLVGATGIGLLLIVASELYANWSTIWPAMTKIFAAFVNNITQLGTGLGNILKGIFTLDSESLKLGLDQAKAALIKGFDDIREAAQGDPIPVPGVTTEEDVKKNEKNQALLAEQNLAFKEAQDELRAQDRAKKQEEDQLAFEEKLTLVQDQSTIEQEVDNELKLQAAEKERERQKQFISDRKQFGATVANINKVLNSEEVQSAKNTADQLVQLQQSKNSTLKGIGKVAAITQIGISTAEGATKAYASLSGIPIVGPALGLAAAGALVAFGAERIGQVQAANEGGIIRNINGGSNFGDSQQALLTPGELVVPTQNFDEVVNAVASNRSGEPGEFAPSIMVGFDGDEAENVITVRQNEAEALGTSRRIA